MAEDTSSDQVSEGFNLVLDQLPNARENLVKELTAAAERGDFDAVAEVTDRLRGLDLLTQGVRRMQLEWCAISHPSISDIAQPEIFRASPVSNQASRDVPGQFALCSPTLQALRTLEGEGRIRDYAKR